MHRGSCLCRAVSFEVVGELKPPDACHCHICRKQSGHFFVSTNVPRAALTIQGAENVTWYRSSDKVRRGFCSSCGSPLVLGSPQRDPACHAIGAIRSPKNNHLEHPLH